MNDQILLPMMATLSSSKTRYGGRLTSLSLHVGGFLLGWLNAEYERYDQVLALLVGTQAQRSQGHSGSKHTIDPKHSWSGYNLDPEKADGVMRALFGTSVVDELNRVLGQKDWVIFKNAYCLPRERLNRFIGSKCRDRTWCDAVRFKESPPALVAYLKTLATENDEDDFLGAVASVRAPAAPPRERMRWRCEECCREGHRESFRERAIPGLAGSVGLDCPNCDYRKADAVTNLLRGTARGDVRRLPSTIIYPGA